MARTLKEIREGIGAQIMNQPELVAAMDMDGDKTFEGQVSSVNVLKLLTNVVAAGIYFHEQVFDRNQVEMQALLASRKPHQLQWYRDKVLNFQYGPASDPKGDRERGLLPDSDEFDNSDIQGSDLDKIIATERIVKYAAAVEKGGRVYIKVAKGEESDRQQMAEKEAEALEGYFCQIKDAGVIVQIVNRKADDFGVNIDIYYDPVILDQQGLRLDGLDSDPDPIRNTIRKFVQNLPFDSVYKNSALVDELQKIPGVIIPEIKDAKYRYGTKDWQIIDAKVQPDSGYFKVSEDDMNLRFIPYDANN